MAFLRHSTGRLGGVADCAGAAAWAGGGALPQAMHEGETGWQHSWGRKGGSWFSSEAAAARRKIAVAISGGVDSAVAALLLKKEGHEVMGVFMRNWDEAEEQGNQNCSLEADYRDADKVCRYLGIPLHTADFVSAYWTRVFTPFLAQCGRGLTPNPDLPCNRHIKFDALLSFASSLGAEQVATGHYARLRHSACGGVQLLKGVDLEKDQSYFLASVKGAGLRNVLFPVGHLSKLVVRDMAQQAGLHVAARRSTAGICFIGRRKFGEFLAEYSQPMAGLYVDVDSGETLGECPDMLALTHGQRAPLGGNADRMFVAGKDIVGGRVFLALGRDHPALYSHTALLRKPLWISGDTPSALRDAGTFDCHYKARYRQQAEECSIALGVGTSGLPCSNFMSLQPQDMPVKQEETLLVRMPAASRAITPQQEFVMYDGEVCLGSAPVVYAGPSLAESKQVAQPSLVCEHRAFAT